MTAVFLLFLILHLYFIIKCTHLRVHQVTCTHVVIEEYKSFHIYANMCICRFQNLSFFCWIKKDTEALFSYRLPWFLFRKPKVSNPMIHVYKISIDHMWTMPWGLFLPISAIQYTYHYEKLFIFIHTFYHLSYFHFPSRIFRVLSIL